MNLTESEKKLAYQIESTDQIGTLRELAMMNRCTTKPEIKNSSDYIFKAYIVNVFAYDSGVFSGSCF